MTMSDGDTGIPAFSGSIPLRELGIDAQKTHHSGFNLQSRGFGANGKPRRWGASDSPLVVSAGGWLTVSAPELEHSGRQALSKADTSVKAPSGALFRAAVPIARERPKASRVLLRGVQAGHEFMVWRSDLHTIGARSAAPPLGHDGRQRMMQTFPGRSSQSTPTRGKRLLDAELLWEGAGDERDADVSCASYASGVDVESLREILRSSEDIQAIRGAIQKAASVTVPYKELREARDRLAILRSAQVRAQQDVRGAIGLKNAQGVRVLLDAASRAQVPSWACKEAEQWLHSLEVSGHAERDASLVKSRTAEWLSGSSSPAITQHADAPIPKSITVGRSTKADSDRNRPAVRIPRHLFKICDHNRAQEATLGKGKALKFTPPGTPRR